MAQVMHLTQQENGTEAELLARPIADNYPGHWYYANDTEHYFYAGTDGTLIKGLTPSDISPDFVRAVAGTDTVGLSVDGNGELTANVKVDSASNNVAQATPNGIYVPDIQIAAGSSALLDYDPTTRAISVKQLLVSDVTVNDTEADLAAFVAANYTGSEQQKGDVVILTQENKAYIHNGGTAGDATDFSLIETPGLSNEAIRALFSGDDVINYNPATGAFTFNVDNNSDSSVSVSADGLKIVVKDGEVTDTNNVLGGGVTEVSLQSLLDGIAGLSASAIQSYTVSGDTGSTSFDKGDNVTYSGGSLLATNVTETNGEVTVNTDFDTTGGTAGQVIKLVDDGTGNLTPEWAVDSASGFTNYAVPFGGTDGTLQQNVDQLYFNYDKGNLLINIPGGPANYFSGGAISARWDGAANNSTADKQGYLWFGNGGLIISDDAQDGGVPRLKFSARKNNGVDADGNPTGGSDFAVGAKLATFQSAAWVGANQYGGGVKAQEQNRGDFITYEVSEQTGSVATNNQKVGTELIMRTRSTSDTWNGENEVLALQANGKLRAVTYATGDANYMYVDANGVIQTGNKIVPDTLGTVGQILKVVDDGSGNLSLQWAEDTSGAFSGANNGLSFDTGTGNVQLGGALIQNTAIDLTGVSNSGQDFSYSITGEETDIYFGMISGGITMRSADMGFYLSDSVEGTVFKDTRTGTAQVGMQYAGDYSANFVNESLITKRYVDSVVEGLDFTQYTINNGLTELTDGNGNSTIQLGGVLTQATTINLQDKDFSIIGTSGKFTANTDMYFGATGQGVILKSPNGTQWRLGVTDFGAATFSSI